jgi:hypothetical protein
MADDINATSSENTPEEQSTDTTVNEVIEDTTSEEDDIETSLFNDVSTDQERQELTDLLDELDILSDEKQDEARKQRIEAIKKECIINLHTISVDEIKKRYTAIVREVVNISGTIKKDEKPTEAQKAELTALSDAATKIKEYLDTHNDVLVTEGDRLKTITADDGFTANKYKDQVTDKNKLIEKFKTMDKMSAQQITSFMNFANSNTKRITLVNSGFMITMKAPTVGELNELYNELAEHADEYGYIYGAYSYMFVSAMNKKLILSFMHQHIIGSTFKSYKNYEDFCKVFSFNDFDTLVHAMTTLMYPEGYQYTIECSDQTECKHSETKQLDLNKFKYVLANRIPADCQARLISPAQVDASALTKYRAALTPDKVVAVDGTHSKTPLDVEFKLAMKVPTMAEYFAACDDFNSSIQSLIDEKDINKVLAKVQLRHLRMFSSWIREITMTTLDADENAISQTITNKDAILNILDEFVQIKSIVDDINNFIKSSNPVVICIPVLPCPNCGKMPSGNINGFVPVDLVSDFFSMCRLFIIAD